MLHDLRFAVRTLLKSPGFAAVAILALALGIGANTAIFSFVYAYLLRPLPYPDSDRLAAVDGVRNPVDRIERNATYRDFEVWKTQSTMVEEVAAFRYLVMNLGGDEPESLYGFASTENFFRLLGARPALGRGFLPEEDSPGGNRVVVLSHAFWMRRFSGNPAALGQTLKLGGLPHTIVGVMPADFRFIDRLRQFWVPLAMRPEPTTRQPFVNVLVKVKPGVALPAAAADLAGIVRADQGGNGPATGWSVRLPSLHEQMNHLRHARDPILVLLAAVGFVLLISCANVANLLLARAVSRSKEVAIRTALGASRWRLARQMLTESTVLAASGGVLGMGLGALLLKILTASAPVYMLPLGGISISGAVLGFSMLVAISTGFLFGLAPAVHALKTNLNETLKESGRGTSAGRSRGRLRNALVVAEVAPALMLLIGAGLLIKSFAKMQQVELGFHPENVLSVDLPLTPAKYPEPHQRAAFYTDAVERVERIPGVISAGAVSRLGPGPRRAFRKLTDAPTAGGPAVYVGYRPVTPGYFHSMGIPLRKGRYFTPQDRDGSLRVAIINETMARRFWPDEDPIGKVFEIGADGAQAAAALTIVGVTGDDRQSVFGKVGPESFTPQAQDPPFWMSLSVRAAGDPARLSAAIASEVRAVDAEQPVANIRTMERFLEDTVAPQRVTMQALTIFAGIALLLAAVGLYGVIAYNVTQRKHEMGVRMALGASRTDVERMVIRQGLTLTLIGLGIGLAGAFAVTRLMSTLLFGVGARDAAIFAAVPVALVGVALLASYIPARRASRVDPVVALRHE